MDTTRGAVGARASAAPRAFRRVGLVLGALVALAALAPLAAAAPEDEAPTAEELRAALARSLPLLQQSMDTWIGEVSCISCHHQGLGTMAVVMARERGLEVDAKLHERQLERLVDTTPGGALHGDAGINGTFGRGFQLLALGAAGVPRDERTDAVAHFLAGNAVHRADGRVEWLSTSYRPPLEASRVTGTAVAVRALDLYRADARAAETEEVLAGARRALERLRPQDAEERAMRLLGLRWAGADEDAVRGAAADVLRAQREDGGWAQLATMESDAYATGQALTALVQAGGLAADDPVFRRGVRYLLETQLEDGSWLVETRRRSPGLPYFETGFPHRLHQFISTAATAWSAMALCCALDPSPSAAFRGARPPRGPEADVGLSEVHLAAAFGTLDDLRAALDAGGDPNARGAQDLAPLHVAVHDARRVELLLGRGAEVDPRTAFGATPLVLAAWYGGNGGNGGAAERLLDAGADPRARAHEDGMTPLLRAVRSAKPGLVRRLVEEGADLAQADTGDLGPLHWAVSGGDVETTELLLELGVEVDVLCEDTAALSWASYDGEDALVRLLLAHGADPNLQDELGMTALAMAARVEHGHARVVEALLAAGADASIADGQDKTPLDRAREFENELAVELLDGR